MRLNAKDMDCITILNTYHGKRKHPKHRKIPFVEVINNKIVFQDEQEKIIVINKIIGE